jgi:predicted nuclease of predicted toxin-antitoxin system
VKLLFDANISRRIVPMLSDLFPESTHTTLMGLSGETPDKIIWEFAKANGFSILTADADFVRLAEIHGAPPKIIRLEKMNYSTEVAATIIRRYAVAIIEFEKSTKSVLVLRRTFNAAKPS